jgi:hypothetical protein
LTALLRILARMGFLSADLRLRSDEKPWPGQSSSSTAALGLVARNKVPIGGHSVNRLAADGCLTDLGCLACGEE